MDAFAQHAERLATQGDWMAGLFRSVKTKAKFRRESLAYAILNLAGDGQHDNPTLDRARAAVDANPTLAAIVAEGS